MSERTTRDASPAEIITKLGGGTNIVIEIPADTEPYNDTTELKKAGISGVFRVNSQLKETK